ncbi:MAG: sensor of ECF-type sigma factor [Bacteroidia bacterium]|nr:sensor of ECF-type sigma factor [Bacteroidia bacterium]NND11618.1 sensor of ECF-type sigma factor [Flavobacteriaceae bacterium]NNK27189.1 sensor of ECF-type sigma factor [Flavobacteriaceae bacterium]
MKKRILIPILIFMVSFSAWSQQPSGERIKAMKVAHITKKLDLSSKEAQDFWPIYNAFDDKTSNLRNRELRDIKREIRQNSGSLSDAQADQLLDRLMNVESGLHSARVTLVNDLKKVISSEKIIRLKAAEDEFNQMLLQRLREMRQKRLQRKN